MNVYFSNWKRYKRNKISFARPNFFIIFKCGGGLKSGTWFTWTMVSCNTKSKIRFSFFRNQSFFFYSMDFYDAFLFGENMEYHFPLEKIFNMVFNCVCFSLTFSKKIKLSFLQEVWVSTTTTFNNAFLLFSAWNNMQNNRK